MATIAQRPDAQTAEPADDRARFHIPVNHFKPLQARAASGSFEAERLQVVQGPWPVRSRALALDRSAELGLDSPATTPTMLAHYLQLRAADPLSQSEPALSRLYYVHSGSGRSLAGDEVVPWAAGDVLVLPAASGVRHEASADSLVFTVSDEPLWRYLGVRALSQRRPGAVRYTAAAIAGEMARLDQLAGREEAVGRAVIFTRDTLEPAHLTTPFFIANINTLEAGRDQRAHCHNGAALTLSLQGESCSSFVAGQRIDWAPLGVMVTPAGAAHSHHNRGSRTMISLVVQDSGFYQHAGVSGFRFAPDEDPRAAAAIDRTNVGIAAAVVAAPRHIA
ncbi:hypothetical protein [Variovorax sp.]|uniref:hypothetical protein n=1 Tax=Variovorax sp. TaxID=1871043 RepID=UPI002D70F0B1|nr:hypothetical protein [Variovorax sp.]HYP85488.1 hypothetical protein [Variovorax sp.]